MCGADQYMCDSLAFNKTSICLNLQPWETKAGAILLVISAKYGNRQRYCSMCVGPKSTSNDKAFILPLKITDIVHGSHF